MTNVIHTLFREDQKIDPDKVLEGGKDLLNEIEKETGT